MRGCGLEKKKRNKKFFLSPYLIDGGAEMIFGAEAGITDWWFLEEEYAVMFPKFPCSDSRDEKW